MFSIKRIAAAAALAAVAGSATAAITAGDLVLVAYDPIAQTTYIRDLGVTGATLTSAFSITGDANWTSFFNAANGDQWEIAAYTGAGTTTVGYISVPSLQAISGSNMLTGLSKYTGLVAAPLTFSATNSAISGTANLGTASDFAVFDQGPTLSITASNSVGSSLLLEQANNGRGNVATNALVAGITFTLGANGGLTAGAAVPPPAVPEPGTWALMVAGLLTVGAIARRRAA